MLLCPRCHRLVHTEELTRLASLATRALERDALADARDTWRRALRLLPEGSQQHAAVADRVEGLSRRVEIEGPGEISSEVISDQVNADSPEQAVSKSRTNVIAASVVGGGLFLWKFKFVASFILTKGKLLLLGLTKASTVFSMLLSLGVYWAVFGWTFAAGLVASIYVHEMGHVAALRRIGISATAPMFIPGLGAMVRLKESPASPREDARVGLAGPIWGLGAALMTYAAYGLTGWASLAAIARVAAWINLFNLIPVWQLDGNRGFRSLTRLQRGLVAATMGGLWIAIGDGLFLLLLVAAGYRTLGKDAATVPDTRAFLEFIILLVGLGALCSTVLPGMTPPG
jgi:Zn-dependent protease